MNSLPHNTLNDVLVKCLMQYRGQMTLLFGCFDAKRAEVYQHDIIKRKNGMVTSFISEQFLLAFDTYATSILAAIGIFINILGCCHLLNRSNRKHVYNLMLASMLLFDITYLISKLMRGLEFFIPIPNEHLWLYYTIANTGARFSLTSSILMIVGIGRIRYQAVRKPLHQRLLLSSSKQRIQMLLKYLIPAMILSFSFSCTTPFEIDQTPSPLGNNHLTLTASSIRLSPLYSFFVLGMLNIVLLGLVPFACLIYFGYKIVLHTNKRRLQNRYAPDVIRMMNENIENVSKMCVMLIITFIILHSPRLITSVGEFWVAAMLNKEEITLQFGHGVPIWLQALAPISELCTILNSCLNVIIYKYLTSIAVLRYCPSCLNCCFRDTTSVEIPTSLPTDNVRRTNTPVQGNASRHLPENNISMDVVGLVSMDNTDRVDILTEEHHATHSSDHAFTLDLMNETCTFQVHIQGQE